VSYGFRLIMLSLASFFLVHFLAAVTVGRVSRAAICAAGRMRASAAARFLLLVRFTPPAVALFAVAALCVPSFLYYEPATAAERIGWGCWMAAASSVAIWTISLVRGLRAMAESRRWLLQPGHARIALAGIVRPRVILEEEAARALTTEQLAAALRHERAHAESRDNLKRLLLLLAPDALPFRRGFAAVELAWKKYAEWSADDRAVEGDAARSISLAAALVAIARLNGGRTPALVNSLLDGDLRERVERLLSPAVQGRPDRWTPAVLALGAAVLATAIFRPPALFPVHRLLELLVH